MLWVYELPPWQLLCTVVAGMSVLAIAGLIVFQRFFPQSDEITHNDVAGPIIGTVGTILAVVLSFLLLTVWQQYDAAAATVEQEATAVADLYHTGRAFPEPVQSQLRETLKTYVNAVVTEEWPAMRAGGHSETARRAALDTYAIVARYQPQTNGQTNVQQDAISLIHTFQDARRERLFDNDSGIPIFFWVGNVLLAAITIGLTYLFRVRSRFAHYVMALSLTFVIAVIFVLTALFDYPFRGSSQIPPTTFVHLQAELDQKLPPITGSATPTAPK